MRWDKRAHSLTVHLERKLVNYYSIVMASIILLLSLFHEIVRLRQITNTRHSTSLSPNCTHCVFSVYTENTYSIKITKYSSSYISKNNMNNNHGFLSWLTLILPLSCWCLQSNLSRLWNLFYHTDLYYGYICKVTTESEIYLCLCFTCH